MSNKYPNAFYSYCVGKVPCDGTSECIHQNSKMDKDIHENKKLHLLRERILPSGRTDLSKGCSNQVRSICEGYESPSKKIEGKDVNFEIKGSHTWSNTRSYGNIVIATNDTCNNIHGKVKPFTLRRHM